MQEWHYLLLSHPFIITSCEKYRIKYGIKSVINSGKLGRLNSRETAIKMQYNYNHNPTGILWGLINSINTIHVEESNVQK